MIEHRVEIPAANFTGYPGHTTLRIFREGSRYNLELHALGTVVAVAIDITPHDLAALKADFRREIEPFARQSTESNIPTPAELRERLRPLAEVGHHAYREIFGHRSALQTIQAVERFSTRTYFEVASEDFFLPWELLYPNSLEEPLSHEHFWGLNHIISRVIVQKSPPPVGIWPVIPFTSRPKLGLLVHRKLTGVKSKEIPFFGELHRKGRIALFELRALDPKKKQEEIGEFKSFLDKGFHLAHFACHAFYEEESPALSCIVLSDEFPISIRDLTSYEVTIDNHPLVILNACETDNVNPLYSSHFAGALIKCGARGVVATECNISDTFAAVFAQQLYKHLLAGEPLGESLLATRRHFIEELQNPSGLVYSMYAAPSIRLTKVDTQGEMS